MKWEVWWLGRCGAQAGGVVVKTVGVVVKWLVSLPLDPPFLGSNLRPGPPHRVHGLLKGGMDHSVNTVQKNSKTRLRLAVSKKNV